MSLLPATAGATYLDASASPVVRRASVTNKKVTLFVVLLLAMAIVGANFLYQDNGVSHTAYACDDVSSSGGQKDCLGGITKYKTADDALNAASDPKQTGDDNSLGYLLEKVLGVPFYLNYEPHALAPHNDPRSGPDGDYNCNVNGTKVKGKLVGTTPYGSSTRPTLVNPNCDVPNFMTEAVQSFLHDFIPGGIDGADQESAYQSTPFGLPFSGVPSETNGSKAATKLTALELYGYNLKFTQYYGEWDYIQVATSARLLSNFGFLDDLKLIGLALFNGIKNVASNAFSDLKDGFSSLNPISWISGTLSAVGCVLSALFGGCDAASGVLDTIIGTSDTNVFASNAWNRPDFISTLYGARKLSSTELAQIIATISAESQLNALLAVLGKAKYLPDSFNAIKSLPTDPNFVPHFTTTCSYNSKIPHIPDINTVSAPAGSVTTQAECDNFVNAAKKTAITGTSFTEYFVLADASTAAWAARVAPSLAHATKLGITATDPQGFINTSLPLQAAYNTFTSAWLTEWFAGLFNNFATTNPGAVYLAEAKIKNIKDSGFGIDLSKLFAQALISELNINSASGQVVCTDSEGNTLFSADSIDGRQHPFNAATQETQYCGPKLRSPIQGALFGDGYLCSVSKDQCPLPDTRRTAFSGGRQFLSYLNPIPGIATVGLKAESFTTQISNTFLAASFYPILQQVGADKLIADLVKTFAASIFFPLAALIIALGAMQIFVTALRRRNYAQQMVSIALMCGTFMSAVILLARPEQVIKFTEDAPSAVEQVIVGAIFNTGHSSDVLCQASQTPTPAGKNFEGQTLSFNPQATMRTMLCENWRVFYFDPYVNEQWGTNYSNLDTTNINNSEANKELVGGATVPLGGGVNVHNWALYQVHEYLSGATQWNDTAARDGVTNANEYRLVDFQAGPNNGEGTDSRYLNFWSGNASVARAGYSMAGGAVSILGMVVIISYSLSKIIITLTTTLLILILPFILLIGLHPTAGRSKLKAYFWELVSLMFKRVMMTVLIAMMMTILTSVAAAATNFYLYCILAGATCLAFLAYKKDLIELFQIAPADGSGGFMQSDPANVRDTFRRLSSAAPPSIRNWSSQQRAAATGMAAGAVGGFLAGGVQGAREQASALAQTRSTRARNSLFRKDGVGIGSTFTSAYKSGEDDARAKAEKFYSTTRGEGINPVPIDRIQGALRERPDLTEVEKDEHTSEEALNRDYSEEIGVALPKPSAPLKRRRDFKTVNELRLTQQETDKYYDDAAQRVVGTPVSDIDSDLQVAGEYGPSAIVDNVRRRSEQSQQARTRAQNAPEGQRLTQRRQELEEKVNKLEFDALTPEEVNEFLRSRTDAVVEKIHLLREGLDDNEEE